MASRYVYMSEVLYGYLQRHLTGALYRAITVGSEIHFELLNITNGNWHPIFIEGTYPAVSLVLGAGYGSTLPSGITMVDDLSNSWDVSLHYTSVDSATVNFVSGSTYTSYGNSFLLTDGTNTRRVTLKSIGGVPTFEVGSPLTSAEIGSESVRNFVEFLDDAGHGKKIVLVSGQASLQIERWFS